VKGIYLFHYFNVY